MRFPWTKQVIPIETGPPVGGRGWVQFKQDDTKCPKCDCYGNYDGHWFGRGMPSDGGYIYRCVNPECRISTFFATPVEEGVTPADHAGEGAVSKTREVTSTYAAEHPVNARQRLFERELDGTITESERKIYARIESDAAELARIGHDPFLRFQQ